MLFTRTGASDSMNKKSVGHPAKNILELIGNTPLVRLRKVCETTGPSLYAKLEMFNPCGSVKDRIALSMIEDAERRGVLKPGGSVIEPTSGNTGIGLAMVCAAKGYRCILTMPESMSVERILILKFFGAEVVLTPADAGMAGAISKAEQLIGETKNSFMPMQFDNPANPEIHRKTTAKEILAVLGDNIAALVAGVGTGGTLTGVGEVLKKANPRLKVIAVEPKNSPVLSGGVPGPHKIMGIGAGFIPKVLNRSLIDEIVQVDDRDAYASAKLLAQKEGLFVGMSSGAAYKAAVEISRNYRKGDNIVVIFPDTWERYLSLMRLFEP